MASDPPILINKSLPAVIALMKHIVFFDVQVPCQVFPITPECSNQKVLSHVYSDIDLVLQIQYDSYQNA